MQLSELLDDCRQRLDDLNAPYLWSDTFLTRALNQAVNQACRRALLIYDESTVAITQIAVIAGTRDYALNSLIQRVESAKLASTGEALGHEPPVPELDKNYPLWRQLEGTPTGFSIHRNHIYLNRAPTANDTLYLRVYRMPQTTEQMSLATHEPVIPAEFHEDLEHWALFRAFSKKDADGHSPQDAAAELALFEQRFGKLPSAKIVNALREVPHGGGIHPRPFGGTTTGVPNRWFGHRY